MDDRFLVRGKCKSTGKWVEGYYCGLNCDTIFSPPRKASQIISKDTGFWADVDPETVGGCTGLTDKKGEKIFKGDILKRIGTKRELFYFVDWGEDCAMFVLHCITDNALESDFTVFNGEDFEIIGNIHDNKQMLGRADMPVPDDVSQPVLKPATEPPENFQLMNC